jgi:hypothetical protein
MCIYVIQTNYVNPKNILNIISDHQVCQGHQDFSVRGGGT